MSEFIWTDALWEEYEDLAYKKLKDHYPLRMFFELLEEFKQSKQQSKNNQDWEILKVKIGGADWLRRDSGYFYVNYRGRIERMHESAMPKDIEITSVKVLSSGEIFSVGDITNHGKIIGFQLSNDGNKMFAETFSEGLVELNKVEHKKTILFTTEDGKPIYEGDECWYVNGTTWHVHKLEEMHQRVTGKYMFSTEDAAKEYIRLHRKNYSIEDIEKLFGVNKNDKRWLVQD